MIMSENEPARKDTFVASMDTTTDSEEMYFQAFFGQQLDPDGQPCRREDRLLDVGAGLFIDGRPHQTTSFFGA